MGTGNPLNFWNQGVKKLFWVECPGHPRSAGARPLTEVQDTSTVKSAVKQEGMAACDVAGVGRVDLLSGLSWFKYKRGTKFQPIQIANLRGWNGAGHFKPGKLLNVTQACGHERLRIDVFTAGTSVAKCH